MVLFDACYAKCESRVEDERRSVLHEAARALGSDVTEPEDFAEDFNLEDDDRGRPQGVKPSVSTEVRSELTLCEALDFAECKVSVYLSDLTFPDKKTNAVTHEI